MLINNSNNGDPLLSRSNQPVSEAMEHHSEKSPKQCHDEVRNLFSKLKSWRESSHREFDNIIKPYSNSIVRNLFTKLTSWIRSSQREFDNIIDPYTYSITSAFNDLVNENNKLQDKLSIAIKDRDILLRSVDVLSDELKELKSKSSCIEKVSSSGNKVQREESTDKDAERTKEDEKDNILDNNKSEVTESTSLVKTSSNKKDDSSCETCGKEYSDKYALRAHI